MGTVYELKYCPTMYGLATFYPQKSSLPRQSSSCLVRIPVLDKACGMFFHLLRRHGDLCRILPPHTGSAFLLMDFWSSIHQGCAYLPIGLWLVYEGLVEVTDSNIYL
jgi:hypothetical protein